MKANLKTGFLLVAILLLAAGDLWAQPAHESSFEPEETTPYPHRFSVSGKILYHTFWKPGLLDNGAAYGRPVL